ncbi:hypothetical protein DPMN_135437 [Dreissena polymorpha]|uniref:Uncharacterized protein n=1 Tax=Dreissena polymorpha TaxID=45954 RepID=A0A9D4G0Y9_DREPO|nr:hypothetical protein DPMN_135437 [Dreissena polymorpha]
MHVLRLREHILKEMIQWAPFIMGGNDISTTERPKRIAWNIVKLCQRIRDRGVPHIVVAGICRQGEFREAALDAAQFANMAASEDKHVAKKF